MNASSIAMGSTNRGDWMQSYRGGAFWPADPRPEAYLMDIPTPEKKLLKDYAALEARWWTVIAGVLNLPIALDPYITYVDLGICLSERDGNMKPTPMPWRVPECGWRIRIKCWSAKKAEKMYLRRHRQLEGLPLSWWDRLQLRLNQAKLINNKKLLKETQCTSSEFTGRLARARTLSQATSSSPTDISAKPSRIRSSEPRSRCSASPTTRPGRTS